MRIAFIGQPFDAVHPDALNSVGLVTHNLASGLARDHEVVVYAGAQVAANRALVSEGAGTGVGDPITYRVRGSSLRGQVVNRAWPRLAPGVGRLRHGLIPPLSTSRFLGAGYLHEVARDLAREHFDVVHVQHCTQFLPALRDAAPDATLVLHAHAHWLPQSPAPLLARRLRVADQVVACSDFVRDHCVAYVPEIRGRCTTVYNGVDTDAFDRGSLRATRPSGRPFLLQVGAVSPHKGLHDTLAAFIGLADGWPDLDLRIVGPPGLYPIEETFDLDDRAGVDALSDLYRGDYLELLRRAVPPALKDRVIFTGRVSPEDLVQHFLAAEVMVFPPIWDEGFGLPALEALAAGTPVVVSRSGALPEIVRDGQDGFVVDKRDPDALKAAINALLSDEVGRGRMGESGRRRAHDQFRWPVIVEQLTDLYRSCSAVARRG